MRCIWITLADPEPRHNGQFMYSGGLIEAAANSGIHLDVVGLSRPDRSQRLGVRENRLVWWLAQHSERPRWASLCSTLPHVADRTRSAELEKILSDRLNDGPWDSIVFDGISAGWALDFVREYIKTATRRPKLIYISHNHEDSLRRFVARHYPNPLKRQAAMLDALKVSHLEKRMVAAVDLVTAITPDDARRYAQRKPYAQIEVLTPGYDGHRIGNRDIVAALPRRAVIVGSFDWIAKRMNLEEFITVADPIFAENNAELQIVGSGDATFLDHLRRSVKATHLTGPVEDVTKYLEQARVALVAEKLGGGFKLKVLDYVFNRIPILALEGSVAGVPLSQGNSILFYPNHAALARGALRIIDDVERLNELHDHAYAVCNERFSWRSRGEQLMKMMAAA
jgi:glycosyltransferase involved in cell wall biosynthesis